MDLDQKKSHENGKHNKLVDGTDHRIPFYEFNFPFQPYDIQIKLMKEAYDTFEASKFALLESPTGTGKSLSLICSSLTWLRDHQNKMKKDLEDKKDRFMQKIEEFKLEEEASGDWLSIQTKRQDLNRELGDTNRELDRVLKFEQRNEARRHAKLHNVPLENYAVLNGGKGSKIGDLEESRILKDENALLRPQEIQADEDEDDIEKTVKEQNEDHIRPKIYYASRTHSQLSQFINEIKRTKFADLDLGTPIKVTSLASRANLCVNPEVLKLNDPNAINERCTELQREAKKENRCPYAKTKQVNILKEDILSSVQDIEDIVHRGKSIGSCPYYANRMAIAEAEVVVLPYNNLLHNETRKASSLDLRESIVIVDEAHNILETICSIHSASINGHQLISSHTILSRYYRRYHTRMNPRNALTIKMIIQFLTALIMYLNESHQHEESIIDVAKFVDAANIERFNVFKILDYFNRSQLARKLIGLSRHDNSFDLTLETNDLTKESENSSPSGPTSLAFLKISNPNLEKQATKASPYPMYTLVEFLRSLTNLAHDGRVLTDRCSGDTLRSSLKFILLNPSSQFRDMTREARSIVLAGGTMQPFSEFLDLLFGPLGIESSRFTLFSCGHVIGSKQLYVATLSNGSTGKPLELSFKTRCSSEMIDELGRTVMNLSSATPGGMVCFFPSYDYEQICFKRWTQIGVIANIETRSKQVFREPRQASHVKPILDEYSRVISKGRDSGRGAMLLCVVGGKMSEGINFNDDLGRCVVMIGIPYANIKSGELQQKMSYYDRTCKTGPSSAGQQYYENLCIKGINQSIGRAIRHKNDYAAIILLDRRYSVKPSIRSGLPGWIRESLIDHDRFGPMFAELKSFFKQF